MNRIRAEQGCSAIATDRVAHHPINQHWHRDARRQRRPRRKAMVRHAGNCIDLKHPGSVIFIQHEINSNQSVSSNRIRGCDHCAINLRLSMTWQSAVEMILRLAIRILGVVGEDRLTRDHLDHRQRLAHRAVRQ